MARKQVRVVVEDVDPAQIPDRLVEGGVVLVDLEARGVVRGLEERLKIRRQGGYVAVDMWLVLLLFIGHGAAGGFKEFWKILRPHASALAAAAGRKRLPSPSALSRGLGSVEVELVRDATSWLLTEAPDVDRVLRHPAVQTYDATGAGWHVFDLDPTVTTLRHRALPVEDDYPDAMRRSEETGAPGYSGRKRGDMQFRRMDVQHAGSSVWTHAHLSPGNGDRIADLNLALGNIVKLMNRLEHPLDETMVRMDGEFGSVPYFTVCREQGLPFITRLNRSKLYDDPDVLARLRDATWYRVPDSLSGPVRAATDLGMLTLHAGSKTRRPNGERYEPITVRVVASVFPKDGEAQRGRVLDGWQVELFVVDLPADRWPAPESVAAYYGRTGQENRFAQEDREVGLDRIVSYHLPGQELATLVGLFLLNYRTARGFDLDPPPAVQPAPELRRAVVDERLPQNWPRDPVLAKLLDGLDWTSMLTRWSGWTWEPSEGKLRCPDRRELVLTTVRAKPQSPGRTGLVFCRPKSGCEACAVRDGCNRSVKPSVGKHAQFPVPSEVADKLRERLALVRRKPKPKPPLELHPIGCEAGLHAVSSPRFLPSEARGRFREVFDHARLRVEVDLPPPAPARPRLVAADEADRQHRRQTWAQRNARNRLPDDAVVRIEAAGRGELAGLVRVQHLPSQQAAGSG